MTRESTAKRRFLSLQGLLLIESAKKEGARMKTQAWKTGYLIAALALIGLGSILTPACVKARQARAAGGYFVPADVPRSSYRIDSRIDPESGVVDGRETIEFRNDSSRALDTIALNWALNEAQSIEVSAGGVKLAPRGEGSAPNTSVPPFYRLPAPVATGKALVLDAAFRWKLEPPSGAAARSRRDPFRAARLALAAFCLNPALGQTQAPVAKSTPQTAGERIAELYSLFGSTGGGHMPDWDKARSYFLKEAVVVLRTTRTTLTVFDVDGFIRDFVDFYVKPFKFPTVTLVPKDSGFSEKIVKMKSWEFGDMAHVLVLYEAYITGSPVKPTVGVDSWLLTRRDGQWMIAAVTNELVSAANPIPPELREADGSPRARPMGMPREEGREGLIR
jgi:hypothetical protein